MSRCRYASRRNFISCSRKTGSPVLARYVSELSSRCGLILALYSRPHSSECAVNEHRAIISAWRRVMSRAPRQEPTSGISRARMGGPPAMNDITIGVTA